MFSKDIRINKTYCLSTEERQKVVDKKRDLKHGEKFYVTLGNKRFCFRMIDPDVEDPCLSFEGSSWPCLYKHKGKFFLGTPNQGKRSSLIDITHRSGRYLRWKNLIAYVDNVWERAK